MAGQLMPWRRQGIMERYRRQQLRKRFWPERSQRRRARLNYLRALIEIRAEVKRQVKLALDSIRAANRRPVIGPVNKQQGIPLTSNFPVNGSGDVLGHLRRQGYMKSGTVVVEGQTARWRPFGRNET
jgi:hypothetical protein